MRWLRLTLWAMACIAAVWLSLVLLSAFLAWVVLH